MSSYDVTEFLNLKKPHTGKLNWGDDLNDNFDVLDSTISNLTDNTPTNPPGGPGGSPILDEHSKILVENIPNLDATILTTGTIDIARLPATSLERLAIVSNQTDRYNLTTASVQNGDTVKQEDTGVMYRVVDDTKLDLAAGYVEYTAGSASSVPWSGVEDKPTSFLPSTHIHGNVTNDGNIGSTQNRPIITGFEGVLQAGSFGTTANTFCEGNDSRFTQINDQLTKLRMGGM